MRSEPKHRKRYRHADLGNAIGHLLILALAEHTALDQNPPDMWCHCGWNDTDMIAVEIQNQSTVRCSEGEHERSQSMQNHSRVDSDSDPIEIRSCFDDDFAHMGFQ